MRDFTHGELEWRPWITPLDPDAATEAQRSAALLASGSALCRRSQCELKAR